MVADLFSVLAVVRSLTEHALVSDDTHGEVVYCHTVILPTHHLRCHIARRSRSIFRVLWVPYSSDTQVSNTQVTLFVEHEILWLDISVQNAVLVQVLQTEQHTRHKEFYQNIRDQFLKNASLSQI